MCVRINVTVKVGVSLHPCVCPDVGESLYGVYTPSISTHGKQKRKTDLISHCLFLRTCTATTKKLETTTKKGIYMCVCICACVCMRICIHLSYICKRFFFTHAQTPTQTCALSCGDLSLLVFTHIYSYNEEAGRHVVW